MRRGAEDVAKRSPLENRVSEVRLYPSRLSVTHMTPVILAEDNRPGPADALLHAGKEPAPPVNIDDHIHIDLDLYMAAARAVDLGFDSTAA